ncbi:MAG: hypothetical protein U0838_04840 [Chloroflexota bacterium]
MGEAGWSGPAWPSRRTWLGFGALAAAAVLFWQVVGAGLTFFADDWMLLADRSLAIDSLFRSHNEHLSAIPIAIFVILRDSVGLGPHWLWLLVLHLAHVAAAAGVLVLAGRRVRPPVALAAAAALLFLGTAGEELLWMVMVSVVISTAAGVWALVILDARRPRGVWPGVLAAALVAVGLLASSFGIAMAVSAGISALSRRNRAAVLALVPVGALYVGWYIARAPGSGPPLCAPVPAVEWAVTSVPLAFSTLLYAVGAPLGVGLFTQPLIVVAAAVAALWLLTLAYAVREGAPVWLPVATLAGIATVAVLIAGSRACLGPQVTGSSRYIYTTGCLALVGMVTTPATGPAGRLVRGRPTPVVAVATALALALGGISLVVRYPALELFSQASRAAVNVALSPDGLACHTQIRHVDDFTANLEMMPTTARLRELVPSPGLLDPPGWSWVPPVDADLQAQVRHLMCEVPPSDNPAGG